MDVLDRIWEVQSNLVNVQVELARLADSVAQPKAISEATLVETPVSLNTFEGGFRITVPEFPPRTAINKNLVLHRGEGYRKARNWWYELIRRALKEYAGPRIDPALVYIVYYVPRKCDVDNFIEKFVLDGLMYAGGIAIDDNLEHVPILVREIKLDPENPRTEIFVLKDIDMIKNIRISYQQKCLLTETKRGENSVY